VIFSKTLPLVLSGRKTQTLRLAYLGDFLGTTKTTGEVAVLTGPKTWPPHMLDNRPRWIVGHTYTVQPERCHPAKGRIEVTYLREVLDPLTVDAAFVNAEGFDAADDYLRIWHELHSKNPVQRCWAIGFKLTSPSLAVAKIGGGE
jgi:hypothetical protein